MRSSRSTTLAQRLDAVQQRRWGLLALATIMGAGMMVSGCNTTAGAGQDVSATGNAITRGATDVKSRL